VLSINGLLSSCSHGVIAGLDPRNEKRGHSSFSASVDAASAARKSRMSPFSPMEVRVETGWPLNADHSFRAGH
jgi:hypothetical protein